MKIIRKNQVETLELRSTVLKWKKSLEEFNSIFELATEKNQWTLRQVSWDYPVWGKEEKWTEYQRAEGHYKNSKICIMGVPEEEERKDQKEEWRNSGWKLPKFDEKH